MANKITRTYKEKDVKRLIASAAGRCCYRHNGEICKRLLVNHNSVIGEKAHIIAIGKKGARYDSSYPESQVNSYDNLMWLCPTHHTMIDKLDDEDIYTVDVLLDMKRNHERDMRQNNYSSGIELYDTVFHDYSALSTLFEFVNINKIYSCTLDLPRELGDELANLIDMVDAFEEDNGDFYLLDLYFNKLFQRMLSKAKVLWFQLTKVFYLEYMTNRLEPLDKLKCSFNHGKSYKDLEGLNHFICEYQESVEHFINALKNRYPEIFYKPVYQY
ncbi:HNH endonuclease signature motif containing protein [Vibrio scophthalmi]|uniref:HNH endonuclease signature motif containing protein n=1 Tax=Vibrio scophthalmi TaxID=45658 RepID=UPI003EBCBF98